MAACHRGHLHIHTRTDVRKAHYGDGVFRKIGAGGGCDGVEAIDFIMAVFKLPTISFIKNHMVCHKEWR